MLLQESVTLTGLSFLPASFLQSPGVGQEPLPLKRRRNILRTESKELASPHLYRLFTRRTSVSEVPSRGPRQKGFSQSQQGHWLKSHRNQCVLLTPELHYGQLSPETRNLSTSSCGVRGQGEPTFQEVLGSS